jgi:RNA polymerase sigma factor (sigma-70 family)
MASRRSGDLSKQLQTLFQLGTVGGLSDAQLLKQFVARRNEDGEAAFRTLVDRHGPMVLRVCRSVLHDPNDADDALQATFLVLARKAGTIRDHDSIGSWLHGVAHRVALKAQTAARRRRVHESHVAEVTVTNKPVRDRHDFAPALHQEIERLPAKYRAPFVLCYLEGRDGSVFLLDAAAGEELGRVEASEYLLKVFAFSPDGRILATQLSIGSATQKAPAIRLWDIAGRRELGRIEGHRSPITALAVSPDGSRLISASEDATALIWDVAALTTRGNASRSPALTRKEQASSVIDGPFTGRN